jgi:hypothetical protein
VIATSYHVLPHMATGSRRFAAELLSGLNKLLRSLSVVFGHSYYEWKPVGPGIASCQGPCKRPDKTRANVLR